MVLAIVTAVVDAAGAGHPASAPATLAAYRPALIVITGVAAIGTLVALSGLRSQRDLPAGEADELAADLAGRAGAAEAAPVREFAKDRAS